MERSMSTSILLHHARVQEKKKKHSSFMRRLKSIESGLSYVTLKKEEAEYAHSELVYVVFLLFIITCTFITSVVSFVELPISPHISVAEWFSHDIIFFVSLLTSIALFIKLCINYFQLRKLEDRGIRVSPGRARLHRQFRYDKGSVETRGTVFTTNLEFNVDRVNRQIALTPTLLAFSIINGLHVISSGRKYISSSELFSKDEKLCFLDSGKDPVDCITMIMWLMWFNSIFEVIAVAMTVALLRGVISRRRKHQNYAHRLREEIKISSSYLDETHLRDELIRAAVGLRKYLLNIEPKKSYWVGANDMLCYTLLKQCGANRVAASSRYNDWSKFREVHMLDHVHNRLSRSFYRCNAIRHMKAFNSIYTYADPILVCRKTKSMIHYLEFGRNLDLDAFLKKVSVKLLSELAIDLLERARLLQHMIAETAKTLSRIVILVDGRVAPGKTSNASIKLVADSLKGIGKLAVNFPIKITVLIWKPTEFINELFQRVQPGKQVRIITEMKTLLQYVGPKYVPIGLRQEYHDILTNTRATTATKGQDTTATKGQGGPSDSTPWTPSLPEDILDILYLSSAETSCLNHHHGIDTEGIHHVCMIQWIVAYFFFGARDRSRMKRSGKGKKGKPKPKWKMDILKFLSANDLADHRTSRSWIVSCEHLAQRILSSDPHLVQCRFLLGSIILYRAYMSCKKDVIETVNAVWICLEKRVVSNTIEHQVHSNIMQGNISIEQVEGWKELSDISTGSPINPFIALDKTNHLLGALLFCEEYSKLPLEKLYQCLRGAIEYVYWVIDAITNQTGNIYHVQAIIRVSNTNLLANDIASRLVNLFKEEYPGLFTNTSLQVVEASKKGFHPQIGGEARFLGNNYLSELGNYVQAELFDTAKLPQCLNGRGRDKRSLKAILTEPQPKFSKLVKNLLTS